MRILLLSVLFAGTVVCQGWAQNEWAPPSSTIDPKTFKEFVCPSGEFKVLIPGEWEHYVTHLPEDKTCGVDVALTGAATMTVFYYGPGTTVMSPMEDMVKAMTTPRPDRPGETVGPATPAKVGGREALRIERHIFPGVKKRSKILTHKLTFMIPIEKGGFFSLEYSAPEENYDKYIGNFDLVLASFEPRR